MQQLVLWAVEAHAVQLPLQRLSTARAAGSGQPVPAMPPAVLTLLKSSTARVAGPSPAARAAGVLSLQRLSTARAQEAAQQAMPLALHSQQRLSIVRTLPCRRPAANKQSLLRLLTAKVPLRLLKAQRLHLLRLSTPRAAQCRLTALKQHPQYTVKTLTCRKPTARRQPQQKLSTAMLDQGRLHAAGAGARAASAALLSLPQLRLSTACPPARLQVCQAAAAARHQAGPTCCWIWMTCRWVGMAAPECTLRCW